MWAFIVVATLVLAKSVVVIHEENDYEHQVIGTLCQASSCLLMLCAAVCALIRAVNR